jgi:TPR repeat protein
MMKRIEANDPVPMLQMGGKCCEKGDYDTAFEYYTKSAELGDAEAHFALAILYRKGEGVGTDKGKEVYHLEKATIGGHPVARFVLAYHEERNGNIERAVKHLIISANLGYEESMKTLWKFFKSGNITKEDLDATLRTHKAAIDAMKSPQREEAGTATLDFGF